MELCVQAIPGELRRRRAWVCWRYEDREGKPTKVPYNPLTDRRARANDPSTWTSFESAVAAIGRYSGIGVMFSDGLCGVDLDHCRHPATGVIEPWAQEVIATLNSYTEVSPSGEGVHILLLAQLPPGGRRRGKVEIYGESSPRYFTVTGARLQGACTEVRPRQAELEAVHARFIGARPGMSTLAVATGRAAAGAAAPRAATSGPATSGTATAVSATGPATSGTATAVAPLGPAPAPFPSPPSLLSPASPASLAPPASLVSLASPPSPASLASPASLSDSELVQRACTARNGAGFSRLWDGSYPDDRSQGDLSLCCHLAFWTGGDAERMDRLFRLSGRYREKWERVDYRQRTIARALEQVTDCYRPPEEGLRTVAEIIARAERGEEAAVWEAIEPLAALPRERYEEARRALKAALGSRIALGRLDAEVKRVRRARREAQRTAQRTAPRPDSGRPVVAIGGQLRDTAEQAAQALWQANEPPRLFVRAGGIVRIVRDERGRPGIGAVGVDELRNELTAAADFVRRTPRGDADCDPPSTVARSILAREHWPLPGLEGLIEVPTLRPDGSVITTPGYDPATLLHLAPADAGGAWPAIPEAPTAADISAARALLDELICDFPFISEADRANYLGLLLTPLIRPAVAGCVPLAVIDAPQAGTGKSLLSEIVALIATGRRAPLLAAPREDEEMRKRLTAVLREGAPLVIFDNVDHPLRSPSLALALTAGVWQDRVLGQSESVALPQRATWVATGNNVGLRGDLPRRSYMIRLDARRARPWLRDTAGFRHPDLLAWVEQQRARFVAALLTLARAWYVAGRPPAASPTVGGFFPWSQTVGGILAHAGVPGFLGNLDALYEEMDEDGQQWLAFLTAWEECGGQEEITTAELISRMMAHDELQAAFPEGATDRSGRPDARRLGHVLRRKQGVRVGEPARWVEKMGRARRVATWKLRRQE